MPTSTLPTLPVPLRAAAVVTVLEGLVMVVLAVLELLHLTGGRLTMGVTTALFFVAYGAALGWSAWLLLQRNTWARSPIVLAQLIQLGLASGFWGAGCWGVALALIGPAVVVRVGLLPPARVRARADEPDQTGDQSGDRTDLHD